MTELILLALTLGTALRVVTLWKKSEPQHTAKQRKCYWCGGIAICRTGIADCCDVHHREHHAPFGPCQTLGE